MTTNISQSYAFLVKNTRSVSFLIFSVPLIILSSFLSIYIPIFIIFSLLIILILHDFRIGTIIIIIFSFSSIPGFKFFQAFHLFLVLAGLTSFSLLLAFSRNKVKISGSNTFNWLFVLLGVWSFTSGIIAIDHSYWITNIELMFRAILVFYLIYNSFSTREDILNIFRLIVLSIFLSSFIPLVITMGGFSYHKLLSVFLERFSGSVFDPNYFSMTIVASIPLAIVLISAERKILIKMFWGFAILFLLFSIIIAQSRTGIFAVSTVFMYALFHLYKKNKKQAVLLALPLLVVILFLPTVFWYRAQLFINSALGSAKPDFSTIHRLTLLQSAFNVFIKNPIFGVGLGNFVAIAGRYTQYPMVCHNTYLEVAANLGLLGLVPFLLILWRGYNILKDPLHDTTISDLTWGVRAGLLGCYIAILFLSVPFKLDFWILLALSAVLYRNYRQK